MADPIRIANCSGFFGDRISAAKEMVEGGPVDVGPLRLAPRDRCELSLVTTAGTPLTRGDWELAFGPAFSPEQVLDDFDLEVVEPAAGERFDFNPLVGFVFANVLGRRHVVAVEAAPSRLRSSAWQRGEHGVLADAPDQGNLFGQVLDH